MLNFRPYDITDVIEEYSKGHMLLLENVKSNKTTCLALEENQHEMDKRMATISTKMDIIM